MESSQGGAPVWKTAPKGSSASFLRAFGAIHSLGVAHATEVDDLVRMKGRAI
jgi:hypothetical protein